MVNAGALRDEFVFGQKRETAEAHEIHHSDLFDQTDAVRTRDGHAAALQLADQLAGEWLAAPASEP